MGESFVPLWEQLKKYLMSHLTVQLLIESLHVADYGDTDDIVHNIVFVL